MQCNIQTLLQKHYSWICETVSQCMMVYLKHWPTFDECMPTVRFWASAKKNSKKCWCSRIEEQVLSKRSKPEISWNWQTNKNTNQQTNKQTRTNKQANIICLCSNQYARHMSENIMEVDIYTAPIGKPESFRNPVAKSRRSNKIRATYLSTHCLCTRLLINMLKLCGISSMVMWPAVRSVIGWELQFAIWTGGVGREGEEGCIERQLQ